MPGSVVLLTGRSFSGKSRVTTVVHPEDELEDVAERIALILGASARAER